jgi:hypothetical protein
MGKRSRKRMTGMTEEERIKKPNKNYQDDSYIKDIKQRNKEVLMFKAFRRLMKSKTPLSKTVGAIAKTEDDKEIREALKIDK